MLRWRSLPWYEVAHSIGNFLQGVVTIHMLICFVSFFLFTGISQNSLWRRPCIAMSQQFRESCQKSRGYHGSPVRFFWCPTTENLPQGDKGYSLFQVGGVHGFGDKRLYFNVLVGFELDENFIILKSLTSIWLRIYNNSVSWHVNNFTWAPEEKLTWTSSK